MFLGPITPVYSVRFPRTVILMPKKCFDRRSECLDVLIRDITSHDSQTIILR